MTSDRQSFGQWLRDVVAWINWDRVIMDGLLGIVAVVAALVSFDALRELAEHAGFSPRLSWALPVVVDAGAGAGTRVWLTRVGRARWFAAALALILIALSIAGNAFDHWLTTYRVVPPWWLVPVVAAVAPVVLAACVHLEVLVSAARARARETIERDQREAAERRAETIEKARVAAELDYLASMANGAGSQGGESGSYPGESGSQAGESGPVPSPEPSEEERVWALIEQGYGRQRLAKVLDGDTYKARKYLRDYKAANGNGSGDDESDS
jgi:hypothetical protein